MTASISSGSPSPGRRLRDLIEDAAILVMPGVFDGFSVKLVERFGFHAAFITGSGISESRLGWPDVGLMGLAENVEACRVLARSTTLPLLADGDTGYGNAVNVHFAVRQFEQTGVAGVMFEDQTWPKRCGHMAGKEVIEAEEMALKVRAAVNARIDPNLVIMARTDAAGPIGIDEAIRRANLYADAGADLLFADALLSEADIKRFCAEVFGPVLVNMGFGVRRRATTPLLTAARLENLGAAAVIYPRMLTAASIRGMELAIEALLETAGEKEAVDRPELTTSFDELNDLVGLPAIQEVESRYAPKAELRQKPREGGQ
jgi:2-methylisocitrate lyase-like PEP mutase family enzyme